MYTATPTNTALELVFEVVDTGVSSFLELAIRSPGIWEKLRNDAQSRATIARMLNWRSEFNFDVIAMNDAQVFNLLLNAGYGNIADVWRADPGMASFFLKNGMLRYLIKWFKLLDDIDSDAGEVSLDSCLSIIRELGSLEIWADVDTPLYDFVCEEEWFGALEEQAPQRPVGGYVARGGRVHETTELIVARTLEMANIEFESEAYVTYGESQRFVFLHFKLEIGQVPYCIFIRSAGRWTVERLDNECLALAMETCEAQGIRLLVLEGSVFFDGGGVEGFCAYVSRQLKTWKIIDDTSSIDAKRCLSLDAI